MDDEFEVELRVDQLEKVYSISSAALQRARNTLESLRTARSVNAAVLEKAERRFENVLRRHAMLRRMLDDWKDQGTAAMRVQPSDGRSRSYLCQRV